MVSPRALPLEPDDLSDIAEVFPSRDISGFLPATYSYIGFLAPFLSFFDLVRPYELCPEFCRDACPDDAGGRRVDEYGAATP